MTKQEKIKAIVDTFINEQYGVTIEHFRLADIMEEKVGSQRYRDIIDRAKRELLDSGKMIASVHGVGYRVVDPDEYTDQSARQFNRGVRCVDRGTRILENAPVKDMTQLGAQRYNDVFDRVHKAKAFMHGARVEIKMLNAKRENPLSICR